MAAPAGAEAARGAEVRHVLIARKLLVVVVVLLVMRKLPLGIACQQLLAEPEAHVRATDESILAVVETRNGKTESKIDQNSCNCFMSQLICLRVEGKLAAEVQKCDGDLGTPENARTAARALPYRTDRCPHPTTFEPPCPISPRPTSAENGAVTAKPSQPSTHQAC